MIKLMQEREIIPTLVGYPDDKNLVWHKTLRKRVV
jgi:hypothetical protein